MYCVIFKASEGQNLVVEVKMKVLLPLCAVLLAQSEFYSLPASAQMTSPNARRAVVLEAFYSLRPAADGGCDFTIQGDCVSSWNFLHDPNQPTNSFQNMKTQYDANEGNGAYSCLASVWMLPTEVAAWSNPPNPQMDAICTRSFGPPSFYDLPDFYGLSTAGGQYQPVGRGGQCFFFANLILYRSGADTSFFPLVKDMWTNTITDANLQDAIEGDVILDHDDTDQAFEPDHVAIVVQIYRNDNTITALDVIDSNYLTDVTSPRTGEREVIGRHAFCVVSVAEGCQFDNVQVISSHYRIYKGTAYYKTPYNPNPNPDPPTAPTSFKATAN
jgi:hypothetical protein